MAVGDAEIPAPYIAVDVEDHAVAAFNLKAFTEQAELFVHTRPMLTIAVNFIVGEKWENALLDMYQFLARIAIKHDQVITDVKEFAAYLENGIASIIANKESFCQAPCSLSNMVTQVRIPPCLFLHPEKLFRSKAPQITYV